MALSVPNDQRKIIEGWVRLALDAGWTLVPSNSRRGRQHYKLRSPEGVMVVLPCTPNGPARGVLNGRAKLRRAGLNI